MESDVEHLEVSSISKIHEGSGITYNITTHCIDVTRYLNWVRNNKTFGFSKAEPQAVKILEATQLNYLISQMKKCAGTHVSRREERGARLTGCLILGG